MMAPSCPISLSTLLRLPMANTTKPNEFFPAIGEVVDQTDKSKDVQEGEENEKVVDEIESLCMKCYEQVRREGSR
jgi:hypothetical protein